MMIFSALLDKDPVGFWILVGLICYPAIMVILFAIAEKIQKFFKKLIDKSKSM
jgi:hypothetical protein